MPNPVTFPELTSAIHAAGLANGVLALHSSLKSFGRLEGGPDTLLGAFARAGCTLLVPTFTYACQVAPQRDIPQNGLDANFVVDTRRALDFDPQGNDVSPDMGSVPARILQTPGRLRGRHPLNSFAALGPLAKFVIVEQRPLGVYLPYQWLYDHPPAYVVLIGVDLTRATPIHFAEHRAGRRLFRRWGLDAGHITECETGGCSDGFNRLDTCLKPIEQNISVGPSIWRIYPFREFVDRVGSAIRTDPQITHCDDPHCVRCNDAVLGGPLL